MKEVGLVLEGGGMRGVFTAGVLDYFMENDIYFPYVVGVSAGACNGSSYVSKQINRTKRVTIDYVNHPDYLSFRNLITKGEIFGMDLIFNDIPMKHEPFDFNTYFSSKQTMLVGATDCRTGKSIYFSNKQNQNMEDLLVYLRASCSIPYVAPIVKYNSYDLLDGGVAEPIPIKKAEADGYKKNIVILTQHREYMKKPSNASKLLKYRYHKYPNLINTLLNRPNYYNEIRNYIYKQEEEGDTFVIQPTEPLKINRFEKRKPTLTEAYEYGYNTAKSQWGEMVKWLE